MARAMSRLCTPSYSALSDTSSTNSSLVTLSPKELVGRSMLTHIQSNVSTGPHKVKYHGTGEDWDMAIENEKGVDVSLVLPQHRARTQPLDYRMNMHVASVEGNVKVKVCRPMTSHRCAFHLQVISASSSDVTVWLPSDFNGTICLQSKTGSGHRPRLSMSPGFSNHILKNAKLCDGQKSGSENGACATDGFDLVNITTSGIVHLKMWDVRTCAPEVKSRETFVKLFGLTKKKPTNHANWDFLLDD